jgi:phosphoglycerate dehydrogenase-like enzyme
VKLFGLRIIELRIGYAAGDAPSLYVSRGEVPQESAAAVGARRVEKDELFRLADILSIHVQLSERTRGLVTARELSLMKPEAYLINTSRGPIVVEADLIAVLRAGRIAGAGIDVFDVEPPAADHPFRAMDNVTVTPHLGYVTRETLTAFYTDTLEAVVAFADDAPIRVANPDALAHAKQRRS